MDEKKIKNLYGLLFELRSMSDEGYSYYAGPDHNYFADWVQHVMGNNELAAKMRAAKSRKEEIEVLEVVTGSAKKPETRAAEPLIKPEQKKPETKLDMVKPVMTEPKPVEPAKKPEDKPVEKPVIEQKTEPNPEIKPKTDFLADKQELKIEKKVFFPKEEHEKRFLLWKHFSWELAKEFMYGMAVGILIGLIFSKMFLR
jgi:hypothetical protein